METCRWIRVKELIWQTECAHQIGTPVEWSPIEGMACMCCHKPVTTEKKDEPDDGDT